MFKFKSVDADQGIAIKALRQTYTDKGISDVVFSKLVAESTFDLTRAYLKAGKVDEIIEFLLDQWDNGNYGFPYFLEVSEELLKKGDCVRFASLWRAVIAERKADGDKEAALEAMHNLLNGLDRLGKLDLIVELRKEIALFQKPETTKFADIDKRKMTESLFWELIEKSKTTGIQNVPAILLRAQNLQDRLVILRASEILRFDAIFKRMLDKSYSWDLWGVAYIAFGGCSDDAFESFRAWIISEGQTIFETLTRDAEAIVTLNLKPAKLEDFLHGAARAYHQKTGQELPHQNELQNKSPSGQEWKETEMDLQRHFPRAYQYFTNTDKQL